MPLGQSRRPDNSGGPRRMKDMRGKLRENREPKGPRSPKYRGGAVIEGREYWVSLWEEEDGALSLRFERKDEQRRDNYERQREGYRRDDYQRPIERDDSREREDTDPGWMPDR